MNQAAPTGRSDHWIDQARAAFDARHYDEALDCLDRAVNADPGSELAHWNRGQVLLVLNRLEEAAAAFQAAQAADPGSHRSALGLARVALVRNDYDRAAALLAAVRDPCRDAAAAEWHQLAGITAVGQRKWHAAIESFRAACALNPDDHRSLLAQYKTHYRAGDLPDAIEALRTLLARDDANQQYLWFLYLTLIAEAECTDALPAAIEHMVEAQPGDPVLYNLGVRVCLDHGYYAYAAWLGRDALAAYPGFDRGQYSALARVEAWT